LTRSEREQPTAAPCALPSFTASPRHCVVFARLIVGIARLRYRPHTKGTAAWAAKKQEWSDWRERYFEMAEQVNNPNLQHQGNIKGVPRPGGNLPNIAHRFSIR